MTDKIPNLEQIPNVLGYMVLDEDQIYMVGHCPDILTPVLWIVYATCFDFKSGGELENNEEISKLALKIAYTAAKVPVNPETKDSFKRISSKLSTFAHLASTSWPKRTKSFLSSGRGEPICVHDDDSQSSNLSGQAFACGRGE